MASYPLHWSLLIVDIEGSRTRDDRAKRRMRAGLYEVVQTAFGEAGIDWDACTHEDRGDAVLVLVPASVPKVELVDKLLGRLQVALHQHNTSVDRPAQIRLRVTVHAGEVSRDGEGWSGVDLDHAFTLNVAPVLRRVLSRSTRSNLAVIVSQPIYDAVIRPGFGPPDLAYVHRVEVDAQPAWIWVPGYRNPLGLADRSGGEDQDAAAGSEPAPAGSQPGEAYEEDGEGRLADVRSTSQSGGITAGSIRGQDVAGGDLYKRYGGAAK